MPLLLAAAMTAGVFVGRYTNVSDRFARRDASQGAMLNNKLVYTLSLIDKMYVDPVGIDTLGESVLPELLARLDPHSVYIPPSEAEEANETIDGHFDGVGIMFNMITDTVIVLNVIPGGPSDKAGVLNGDRIIKINDSIVAGRKVNQDNVVKMLRGKRGTKVTLAIERAGISQLVPVTVERGVIPIKSVDVAFMEEPGCAYIKLSAFSRTSYKEIMEALGRLKGEGMERLILDLRGNTGGFLDQAIVIANEFLPDGDMIVYTLDRNKHRTEEFSQGGGFTDLPLAVLIDEGSASSSEILAGALQDNDRGIILGRRSFGKGLVQEQIPFRDGSAIRLTVSRYYTPAGRSIQKPYVNGAAEYAEDLTKRYMHSEFFSADSIKFADSLRFTTKGGRTVYGGGGIMPDIFIPLDTTEMTPYYFEVSGRNILYRYTLEYSDRHRAHLKEITFLAELDKMLPGDDKLLADFVSYAAARGVTPDRRQIEKSRRLIIAQLKALIGRNTSLENVALYHYLNPVDPVITKAMEMLRH